MNDELQELLRNPREDMDIELKQWMDPTEPAVKAKLAKELIALRNHGGGYLVIGFKDTHPAVSDPARPANLEQFDTDTFNNIIKKYAEPTFHCASYVVAHPVTGETYPVVVVPGGAKVPVRCKADSPDGGKSIKIDTYYIRRPGPESNSPQTAAEWDAFLEKCLLNRKEELFLKLTTLFGAGRLGITGLSEAEPAHPFTALRKFRDDAVARLEELQSTKLNPGDPARFEQGRYVLSARIVGDLKQVSLSEMRELLNSIKRYTGWSPMYVFSRPELAPYVMGDDLIECWLAKDEARDTAHADFWRVSAGGLVTLIRGYSEDSPDVAGKSGAPEVGKGIELTLPPWRIAEFALRVKELGEGICTGPFRLQLIVQWEGIEGRKLFSFRQQRSIFEEYVAHEPKFLAEAEFSAEELDAALPSAVAKVATPLLRRFSFFEPPQGFYDEEIGKLLRREFS